MKFNCVTGLLGSMGILAVSASDVETWVSVICTAVIAIVTCGLQVYKMITDAKNKKDDNTDSGNSDNTDSGNNDNGGVDDET